MKKRVNILPQNPQWKNFTRYAKTMESIWVKDGEIIFIFSFFLLDHTNKKI